MQPNFLTELGVKTPREKIAERARQKREEKQRQADAWRRRMATRADANRSETAVCCGFYNYTRRINTAGWTRCVKCGQPLSYR